MSSSRMSGFRDLGVEERRRQVAEFSGLAAEDLQVLDPPAASTSTRPNK